MMATLVLGAAWAPRPRGDKGDPEPRLAARRFKPQSAVPGGRSRAAAMAVCLLGGCASVHPLGESGVPDEAKAASYARGKQDLGVVLLDARWARQWKCGAYENAQLVSFSFDKIPLSPRPDEAPAEVVIGTTSLLAPSPRFESYALLVQPGEYALSNFRIKVARSTREVDYWVAGRSQLIKNGKPLGGTFRVAPGEAVYVGNFALDCTLGPTLWRYHAKGRDGFNQQLAHYQSKYRFLDLTKVAFRLFDTDTIGRPYSLE